MLHVRIVAAATAVALALTPLAPSFAAPSRADAGLPMAAEPRPPRASTPGG